MFFSSFCFAIVSKRLVAAARLLQVSHPLAQVTMKELAGCKAEVVLVHLNHTNPLFVVDSPERERAAAAGFKVSSTSCSQMRGVTPLTPSCFRSASNLNTWGSERKRFLSRAPLCFSSRGNLLVPLNPQTRLFG